MKILSIHNNELTTKLENIGSAPGVSLVEIPEIIKKDASTSFFNLIDDSNPCNQVLVKNVVIKTCSDEIAMENEQLEQEDVTYCISCGSCQFTCPSHRPILDNILKGKGIVLGNIKARAIKAKVESQAKQALSDIK